jgi:hypothetical protein
VSTRSVTGIECCRMRCCIRENGVGEVVCARGSNHGERAGGAVCCRGLFS